MDQQNNDRENPGLTLDHMSDEDITRFLDSITADTSSTSKPADASALDKTPNTEESPSSVTAEKSTPTSAAVNQKNVCNRSVLVYLHDLVYLLAAIIVIFLVLFRVVVVSGTSMNNTLMDGDYLLLVGNLFYRNPQQGDIIVASKESFDGGAPIVKRIIATEGQMVDINFETGVVTVDGKALDEPYTLTPTNLDEGVSFPLFVEEGCLFVMGDNRNGSKDSRNPEIGLVDRREVLGKVAFLFFPGTNHGRTSLDFHRIGVVS